MLRIMLFAILLAKLLSASAYQHPHACIVLSWCDEEKWCTKRCNICCDNHTNASAADSHCNDDSGYEKVKMVKV